MKKEKQKQEGNQEQLDEKYKELQQTIQQDQNVIAMLKMQLAQYQQTKIDIENASTIIVASLWICSILIASLWICSYYGSLIMDLFQL
jgi:hypothetical protein